jgi:hypothetical protein
MKENLNIAWWHEKLMLCALKRYDTQEQAAQALGISSRTLIRMKKDYNEKHNNTMPERSG